MVSKCDPTFWRWLAEAYEFGEDNARPLENETRPVRSLLFIYHSALKGNLPFINARHIPRAVIILHKHEIFVIISLSPFSNFVLQMFIFIKLINK